MTRQFTPVPGSKLDADHASVRAIQRLPDYQPANPTCSTERLLQLQASLTEAEQAEQAARVALDQARAARAEATHLYHDAVVAARTQVIAQYGSDAAAVSLVGLTRRSERKRPVKRQTSTTR